MVLLKRLPLLIYGPLVFVFLGVAPLFFKHTPEFRERYWGWIKRALRILLRALSIEVRISQQSLQRLMEDQNSVIAANHKSHLDVVALLSVMPDEKWVTFSPKVELYKVPFFARGFEAAGCIPIDRANPRTALRTLIKAVSEKPARESLILFPEGTRWRGPGIGPFKAGVMLVAKAQKLSVRPICIEGSEKLLPPGSAWPKAGIITIEVLPSFTPDAASTDENLARLQQEVAQVHARLQAQSAAREDAAG